jgi:hypothetical protein
MGSRRFIRLVLPPDARAGKGDDGDRLRGRAAGFTGNAIRPSGRLQFPQEM